MERLAKGLTLDLTNETELELEPVTIEIPLSVVRNRHVPATAKLVYGVLKSFVNAGKNTCEPSLIEIGERAGLMQPNVPRILRQLKNKKLVSVTRRGKRNRYELKSG